MVRAGRYYQTLCWRTQRQKTRRVFRCETDSLVSTFVLSPALPLKDAPLRIVDWVTVEWRLVAVVLKENNVHTSNPPPTSRGVSRVCVF